MSKRLRIAAAAVLVLTGCVGEPQEPAAQATSSVRSVPVPEAFGPLLAELSPEQLAGKQIYETLCWICHGMAGRADGPTVKAGAVVPPPNFQELGYANLTKWDLEERFRGVFDTTDPAHPHMQPFARLLNPERFEEALAYIPVVAYPPNLPGSSMAGLALYSKDCVACHGQAGDGQGVASQYLTVVKPADFRADTLIARADFDGLFRRIQEGGQAVHGSSMPIWGRVLTEGEIWDLVSYISTFQQGVLPPLPTY